MAKKSVKKKNSDISKTKTYKTNEFKSSSTGKKKGLSKATWICLAIFVLLLILCYYQLGVLLTIFTAVGILIIIGIARLLDKVKNKKRQKKIINIILIVILTLGILGLAALSAFLFYITVKAPKFNPAFLEKPEVSILYDKDTKEVIKLGSERREKITYDELPQVLVDAIVATEDSRFFQHNGFDAPRFLKASLGQLAGHSDAGGASTLSMQVIKNSFTSTEASGIAGIIRKFTDIYLAVFKLEKNYSKEEIIEFYVNNHFLGGNIYGVEEASQAYFNKNVSDLNLSEAATLAGMFKSPNYYRPTVNPINATERRKTVLYLMRKHGYITKEEEELANSIPVNTLTADASNANSGAHQYQGYIDTVVEELEDKYGVNPYVTPVLVYTNMDRAKQDAVNRIMSGENFAWVNDVVQSGVSVLDSETGKILAVGAGRNKTGANEFNFATQMNRQPGSTAKPLFDYGPLMEYNNASTYGYYKDGTYFPFIDEPYSYSNGKSINNWDGTFMGVMSMRRSLALSRNIPAVKAFQQVDNKKIIEFVTNLGIQPEIENGKIHEAHSLGAFNGVNPVQMSAAYAAFSNGGYYNEPYTVTKLEFRDTGEVKEHKSNKKKVMSDSTAFMIASILQDVQLSSSTIPNVAAKTGTTNYDEATIKAKNLPADAIGDSWVVGFTTKTVIGMWYGYQKIDSTYVSRNVPATIQRDKLFRTLAQEVFEKNKEPFAQPNSVVKLPIVSGSNPAQIAGSGAGNVVYEYFKKGYEPKETAPSEPTLAAPTGFKANFDGNNKVLLSWNAVDPGEPKEGYTFGYNIYFGDTLIDFTDKTTYTYTTNNPYGTYKVIATYKGYSGIQSAPATDTLKEVSTTPSPSPGLPDIKLALTYSGNTTLIGGSLTLNSSDFTVTNNGNTVSATVSNCTPNPITTTGNINVSCKVSYNNREYSVSTKIMVSSSENNP